MSHGLIMTNEMDRHKNKYRTIEICGRKSFNENPNYLIHRDRRGGLCYETSSDYSRPILNQVRKEGTAVSRGC